MSLTKKTFTLDDYYTHEKRAHVPLLAYLKRVSLILAVYYAFMVGVYGWKATTNLSPHTGWGHPILFFASVGVVALVQCTFYWTVDTYLGKWMHGCTARHCFMGSIAILGFDLATIFIFGRKAIGDMITFIIELPYWKDPKFCLMFILAIHALDLVFWACVTLVEGRLPRYRSRLRARL